jgi:hypothetical protein
MLSFKIVHLINYILINLYFYYKHIYIYMNKSKYLRSKYLKNKSKKQTQKNRYKGGTLNSLKRKFNFFKKSPYKSFKAVLYNSAMENRRYNISAKSIHMRRRANFYFKFTPEQQKEYIEDKEIYEQFTPEQKAIYEEFSDMLIRGESENLYEILGDLKKMLNTSNKNKNNVVNEDSIHLVNLFSKYPNNHHNLIKLVENPLIVEGFNKLYVDPATEVVEQNPLIE